MFEGTNNVTQHKNHKMKKRSQQLMLLGLGLLLSVSFAIVPYRNARADKFDDQIRQLEAQNAVADNKVDSLMTGAKNLEGAIATLQGRINDLQAKITANKAKSAQLKEDIKQAEAELEKQRGILGDNIRAMYLEGDISTVEMLATSKNLSDFVDKQQYRSVVSDKINDQLKVIEALKAKLAKQRKTVEELIKQDEAMRREISAQRAEKSRLLQLNKQQQADFNAKIAQNNKKIQEVRKAQAELAAALARRSYQVAPAGYVNAGDVIGHVGNTGLSTGAHLHLEVRINGAVTNPSPYIRSQPVVPTVINQYYGHWDPIYISGWHPGTDYAPGDGNIHAIDSGNLYRGCSNDLLGTSTNPYGYVAIIEHPNGTMSVYGHMSGGPGACNYNTYY